MRSTRISVLTLVFISFSSSVFVSHAHAEATLGDSAMTVAFSTIGGAVLGASTLPFYTEPGEHTKNIFYGAALGAVAGVLISAYAGVKEGPAYEEDEAGAKSTSHRPSSVALNQSSEFRLRAEASTATMKHAGFGGGAPLYWSPVADLRF